MELNYPELKVQINSVPGRDTAKDEVIFERENGEKVAVRNNLSEQISGLKTCKTTLGIKNSGRSDFTLMTLPKPGVIAAVYTRSLTPSVTILRNRECLQNGVAQTIAVNSGNANVFTPRGKEDVLEISHLIAEELGTNPEGILISSTGVIGVPLPMEKFRRGIPGISALLKEKNLDAAADAILTTDLGPKVASVRLGDVILSGIAKGAGMIEPNLATMLVYFFTNAALSAQQLQSCLEEAVAASFNCMSVDGDTSTSDTVALLSSNETACPSTVDFKRALTALSLKLTRDIVSQGEGVTKILDVMLQSDVSVEHARRLAKKIINSPLVKAAMHGADPNWGRIVMAIGKPDQDSQAELINPQELEISLQSTPVYTRGKELKPDFKALSQSIRENRVVQIHVKIGNGKFLGRAWGCDLTEEYVKINADYTT